MNTDKLQSDWNKSPDKRPRNETWAVCNRYGVACAEGGRYLLAARWLSGAEKPRRNEIREYQPPQYRGGLFIDFACLADDEGLDGAATEPDLDTDGNKAVALRWAHRWGVLGLTQNKDGYNSVRGGKADTVARFAKEAWEANAVLRLYEAATREAGPDREAVAKLLEGADFGKQRVSIWTSTAEAAKEKALMLCADITQEKVARYCYPALFRKSNENHFTQGFGCVNLLGAIWMGMFWILWDDQTRRCKNPECNRMIPYRPTPPRLGNERNHRGEGYATRSDRVYCGDSCANRHYYLTKTRVRRRAARKGRK